MYIEYAPLAPIVLTMILLTIVGVAGVRAIVLKDNQYAQGLLAGLPVSTGDVVYCVTQGIEGYYKILDATGENLSVQPMRDFNRVNAAAELRTLKRTQIRILHEGILFKVA